MAAALRRVARPLVVALLVAGLAAGASATVTAKMPESQQRAAWQRVCEHAGGTLSDQPALVCDHVGEPQWSTRTVEQLSRFCSKALGGLPEVRSQYPLELVACFF